MRLKRWESPRREGRNDKGKGGAARARQLKKREQMLRKRLKDDQNNQNQKPTRGEDKTSPFLWLSKDDLKFWASRALKCQAYW